MAELELMNLVKVYPFIDPNRSIFGRKKAREALAVEKAQPYTTNEGVLALQNVSLSVEHGEFLVILGQSGSGKSTLLRMIAGLEDVSAGDILVDGKSVLEKKPEERDIAMVFQNYSLYPHFTVFDNIAFTLRNQHIPRAQLEEMVRKTAEILGIENLLDRMPKELSGGQQQRVAIARAIIRKPKLFLMDEPFSNLDVALRQKMREVVAKLHRELGTTFIYVTHDQMEAMALGTKIMVLRDGIIQQIGSPRDLYNRPQNAFVASFVGTPAMNMYREGTLHRTSSGWQLELLGGSWNFPAQLDPVWDGKTVIAGVRPVHIAVKTPVGVDAVLKYSEPLGTETNLHLQVGEQKVIAVVQSEEAEGLFKDQKMKIALRTEKVHLFDGETGLRIN